MRKLLLGLLVLVLALPACSDDDESPTDPGPSVSFRKVPNVALYGGANYDGMLLYVKEDGSVDVCEAICREDPDCNFFYFNERGGLSLTPLTTPPDACAFFRGTLWVGTANQSDTYVKQIDGVDAWDVEKARF